MHEGNGLDPSSTDACSGVHWPPAPGSRTRHQGRSAGTCEPSGSARRNVSDLGVYAPEPSCSSASPPRVYASLVAPDAWHEPPGGRPPWREPEALLDYIRSSPGLDLGVYNRMWLAEKSSTLMRRSSAPAERALYREAVLLAAEKGRQAAPSVRLTFWLY